MFCLILTSFVNSSFRLPLTLYSRALTFISLPLNQGLFCFHQLFISKAWFFRNFRCNHLSNPHQPLNEVHFITPGFFKSGTWIQQQGAIENFERWNLDELLCPHSLSLFNSNSFSSSIPVFYSNFVSLCFSLVSSIFHSPLTSLLFALLKPLKNYHRYFSRRR